MLLFLVRQFTELRIHALNSFTENIAVFREASIQFSVGGQFFDHYAPPIFHVHPRNISSTQPTWVVIPLNGRVGRFVRIFLTFQSDWIILSEVAFNSSGFAYPNLFAEGVQHQVIPLWIEMASLSPLVDVNRSSWYRWVVSSISSNCIHSCLQVFLLTDYMPVFLH